ncbi:MAG: ATP-binding protein [Arcobacter sp.]|nr:MAG: ATP-binding protein [Arcobacter sp.]
MKYLGAFIKEYQELYCKKEEMFEDSISGQIKKVRFALLEEKFLPSVSLKNLFEKLLRRSQYPMEVAITGQFSSGKSTFLNALLSKDILPTGITPVTSKVNFINYGPEYKLKVTYKNGAQEYHNIENISTFTDQRADEVDDIKYLSIYAPMEILKDISFVDTPGLNSQSLSDTQTTQSVLRDVDGIIWLSLIDNAGKESEAQTLKEYMQHFKEKSLCVLNQKDKFSQEEIDKTLSHVKSKFSQYFQEVIPISAKLALESRSVQKEVLIKEAMHDISLEFKESLGGTEQGLGFFEDTFSIYEEKIKHIKQKDRSQDIQNLNESNIQEVLDYIYEVIRPSALESKTFALQNELRSICDILISEYKSIFGVYESLQEVIISKQEELLLAFDEITNTRQTELNAIYEEVNEILLEVAQEIFTHIKRKTKHRYEENKGGFLRGTKIEKFEYEVFWIDSDSLYKNLFYDDQHIDKKFKKVEKRLKRAELSISKSFKEVYVLLESSVHTWQEPYELITKHREIASDLEFAGTRNFASKVYENVLINYHTAIEGNIAAFKKKFAYLNGVLTLSYKQLINASILHFEMNFTKQINAYEKDPQHISLNMPHVEDIYARLKEDFSFDKVESFLNSRRNYLYKIVSYAKEEYVEINEEKLILLSQKKEDYKEKIEAIKKIQDEV